MRSGARGWMCGALTRGMVVISRCGGATGERGFDLLRIVRAQLVIVVVLLSISSRCISVPISPSNADSLKQGRSCV